MSTGINLRAEFKPLISVVNISIEFPRSVIAAHPRLTLEAHTLSVETKEFSTVFHLEQLTLKPASCRGLRWNSQYELQLTAEAEWNAGEGKAGDADKLKTSSNFQSFNQELLVSKINTCQSRCYCVGCGAQILNPDCKFKRVLPLPSENWTDFADIWFCHNHTHGQNHNHTEESTLPDELKRVKSKGLMPRLDDCLVSSLYMLVSARQVNPYSVTCTSDRLVCKRCGNFVGFVKLGDADSGDNNLTSYFQDPLNGVYKLYFHAVTFIDDCEDVPLCRVKVPQGLDTKQLSARDQSIEDYIHNLLKDQSRLYTSFRFIIDSLFQGEGQSGVLILLWLLDQELAVYVSSSTLPPPPSTSQQEQEKSPGPSTQSCPSDASSLSQQKSSVAPCKYMKLLYKATFLPLNGSHFMQSLSPNVFTAWLRDNTVHSISLPYPLCKQLISLLVSSTKQLSKSQRNLNGFHVGYLRSS